MIECENLVKIYKTDEIEVLALQGLDLTVEDGELMAIIGNSGSGKSTLLNMLGGIDRPSAGKLIIQDKNMLKMTKKDLVKYKRETVGFVWQNNARNLIPYLTATENVELPMIINGSSKKHRAETLLELVGLGHRKNSVLAQLSGGEQQRVAIAIALSNNPSILLADEPTGAVDSATAMHIMDVFNRLNKELGLTIIIVTHDHKIAKRVDRVVAIRDGKTSSEFIRRSYRKEIEKIDSIDEKDEIEEESHIELAIIDKVGRLQIPKEYLENIGIKGRDHLRVEFEDNKISLYPHKEEKED